MAWATPLASTAERRTAAAWSAATRAMAAVSGSTDTCGPFGLLVPVHPWAL